MNKDTVTLIAVTISIVTSILTVAGVPLWISNKINKEFEKFKASQQEKLKQIEFFLKKEETKWGKEYELYKQILSSLVDFNKAAHDLKSVAQTEEIEQNEDFKKRKKEVDELAFVMRDVVDKNWPFLSKELNEKIYKKIKNFDEKTRLYRRRSLNQNETKTYFDEIKEFEINSENIYCEITKIISNKYND